MWSVILNLLSSGAFGAIMGIAGGAVQRHFDLKNAQLQLQKDAQNHIHELELRKMDIEMIKAESESKFQLASLDAQAKESVADAAIQQAAYAFEPQMYSEKSKLSTAQNTAFTILDIIRGLVRPGLTAYFAVFFSLIFWSCFKAMTAEGMTIDPEHAYDLVEKCVNLTVTLFSACTTFYFGTRNKASEFNARKGK